MIKAIIVDDEPLALDVLETYIAQLPELELVARCENALEAREVLKEHNVDLMFLDINMPQLTGIDFLKTLSVKPNFIFTTAHPYYAVEGFELNAIDYLMKPIPLERFMKAVNKVIDMQVGEKSAPEKKKENFIFVKADKKLIKVNFDDILYIEGLKDYVIIRQKEGRVITLHTMKSLEAKLPDHIFKRIHRSYIVNIGAIDAIVGNMIELKEKSQVKHIPIGKNYREELLKVINKNRL
ncbi:LytTR family DNA-binding domain-containing protein [Saprospiraceae bacterium]|nr:LytTR family DNA-binding domain-containing protein [Saprospiraceae bacterium]MDA9264435.1 LytTR family DNA-binding domain-containing protein [Saprospiraceae bacterium]MDA9333347.1 LytTR family DNA-binding domain-containing protein [Saprospiraceae bacterium]MDA9358601.1 LytTR family DNA-binding domain-containing protein [Saprospiraceae bacterium]MDB4162544.1 LytTR family DNA-binding domain-containing protein [Saprospiraceae bacterium]